MGEVWKARDTRLDRTVAIKRLKGEHAPHFQREAHAIAALNHPHVCQIYDIGPDYLVSIANYQFCLSARVFDLLIPLPECAISLFYSSI